MAKFKNNVTLLVTASLVFILLIAALGFNYGYLVKPEFRIGASIMNLSRNLDGAKASLDISSSMEKQGSAKNQQMLWLILNGISFEGDILYNRKQNIALLTGSVNMAGESALPVDFYIPLDAMKPESIEKKKLSKGLKDLPKIEKSRERLNVTVNRLKLPVFADVYTIEMTGNELLGYFGIDDQSMEEIRRNAVVTFQITVDKDCRLRGVTAKAADQGVEITARLTIDKFYRGKAAKTIDTKVHQNLFQIKEEDLVDLLHF